MGMTAEKFCRQIIKNTHIIVNILLLTLILLISAFAVYALWDSNRLYYAADKSHYAIYKPTASNEGKSFKELQALNPEVIAWLNVYGTNIDYPVTQGRENMKYVNANAEGLYSLSGAIFLDSVNSKDFSDFNSIVYGHHMEKKAMFGEIGSFLYKDMFDSHQFGSIYFNEAEHGIEFFAFVHADAYDNGIFRPNVIGEWRQVYLDYIFKKAIHIRDIGVTENDNIILLSTCSSGSTNGRDILIGIITDEAHEDSTLNADGNNDSGAKDNPFCLVIEIPWWLTMLIMLTLLIIMRLIASIAVDQYHRHNKKILP